MPKVSVIIPVYNIEEYLPKCLDSVINQTLKDIEIICIDDCSNDNSLEILKKYASIDDRFIILQQETNQGQGVARNLGLDIAKGEYVGFVDPDDWISTEMYKEMYNQAKKLHSEIVMCDYVRYNEKTKKSEIHKFFEKFISTTKSQKLDLPTGNIDKDIILNSLLISPCYSVNRIYKSELIKKYNIRYSIDRCYEDVLFILRSHYTAQKFSYTTSPFYFYRIRHDSTLRGINNISEPLIKTFDNIIEFFDKKNLKNKFNNNIKYFIVMNTIWKKELFTKSEQIKILKYIKKYLNINDYYIVKKNFSKNILQNVFSVTNNLKTKRKIVNILGVKIKFKYLKGQLKKEEQYINKIKHNQKKYPKDSYLLFDNLNGDIAECIDAYSLYEYLKAQGKNAYYVLLKNTALYKKLSSANNLDSIIALDYPMTTHPGDFFEATYNILLKSKAVITAFGIFSDAGQKFIKNNKYWKYIFIQHGQIFLKETVMQNGYLTPEKFDKILISSEYEYKIFKKYNWSDNKLLKCGLPRWDLLNKDNQTNEKSILVMFTWRRFDIGKFDESLYKKNIISLLSNKRLQKLIKQYNIKLYFAPHHSLFGLGRINFDLYIDNVTCVDPTNISKYIKECDCLITDWSSVAFDFMFQNKPVIYYILDKKDEILGKADREDIRHFDYKKYIMPNVFFDEESVMQQLTQYIENNFELEPETKNKYEKFFYIKENIREKLTNEIDKICSEKS